MPRRDRAGAKWRPGEAVAGAYQDWPKADLLQRAREIGIEGRSSMTKAQLISALRNH
jgi:hypothetical protein